MLFLIELTYKISYARGFKLETTKLLFRLNRMKKMFAHFQLFKAFEVQMKISEMCYNS